MKRKLSDLWRWDGNIGRGTYLFWGVLLFAVKFNLDRFLGALGLPIIHAIRLGVLNRVKELSERKEP